MKTADLQRAGWGEKMTRSTIDLTAATPGSGCRIKPDELIDELDALVAKHERADGSEDIRKHCLSLLTRLRAAMLVLSLRETATEFIARAHTEFTAVTTNAQRVSEAAEKLRVSDIPTKRVRAAVKTLALAQSVDEYLAGLDESLKSFNRRITHVRGALTVAGVIAEIPEERVEELTGRKGEPC